MKRTGFRRPVYEPAPSAPLKPIPREMQERIRRGPALLRAAPKSQPVRHEGYRRLVAAGPCCWCGIAGYSQAAHANEGKGMGTKTDDRTAFALCAAHPGHDGKLDPGCHELFDAGGVLSKAARRLLEQTWGRQTRLLIRARGLWPADLPPWPEDQ